MALAGNLVVNVLADTKKFKNGMRDVEKTAKGTMQRIGKLTSLVRRFWGEIGFAIMAMRKIVKVFKDFTQAAFDDEKATALLNSTLQATGIYTEALSQQLQDYADTMQMLTGFTDEQIVSAQGVLATFTQIGTEAYPEVIERAMDMSAIFGVDLQQAIIQLGKAINDPRLAEGLRRIGITMSQSQVDMIDNFLEMGDVWSAQRVILDELKLELGGAAVAYGKTLPGQVDILKKRFDELKEKIGYAITENLPDMIEAGTRFAEWADKVALTEENINKVQATVQALIGVVVIGFQMWITRIRTLVTAVKIVLDTISQFGQVIDIVFNPKNWGKGTIKKQLKEIEWTADELFKGIVDGWGNVADEIKEKMQRVRDAWTGANEEIKETAEKTAEVVADLTDEFGFTPEEWDAYEKAISEFDETMVLTGKHALQWRESMLSAERGAALLNEKTEERADGMEKIIDLMAKMSIMEYDYGVAVEEVTEKVEKLTWAEEQLKDMKLNLADMTLNSVVPAFEAFAATTESLGTMMKDFIKTAIANLFKALAAYLAQMAVLFALGLQFGKAAVAAAGSIAAYVVASEVANMQMGGIVEQMQGMQMGGFGDIVPTMLEPGEMVIPKETVQREQPAIQEAIGGESGGQHIQIFLDGRELSGFVTKQIRNKNILVDARAVV